MCMQHAEVEYYFNYLIIYKIIYLKLIIDSYYYKNVIL